MNIHLVVLAKAPRPGRVKTRLCPPCTPEEAAHIAAAALADTMDAVQATPAARRTLMVDADHPAPAGWSVLAQRGGGLGQRLAHAFADTALPGVPTLLIGMDTPQVTPAHLTAAAHLLGAPKTEARRGAVKAEPRRGAVKAEPRRSAAEAESEADAVLGPAEDGGWWALGLRDPAHAVVLPGVPMSTADTGARTEAALRARGLRIAPLAVLRDVDTAADAWAVAAQCGGGSRFAAAVPELVGLA